MTARTPSRGSLFVIDGDLTKLNCDAVLIPVDVWLNATSAWESVLGVVGRVLDASPPAGWGDDVRSFLYRAPNDGPQIWLGDIGKHNADDGWYAAGLVDFLERASALLDRTKVASCLPRLAVNVAGAGAGGSASDKGRLFTTMVPALTDAAQRLGVDVVLVCFGHKQYAAAQRVRKLHESHFEPRSDRERRLENAAQELAGFARRSDLVLFIGAGVSTGAGLQSWQGLLNELLDHADIPLADRTGLGKLDVRDQPHLIRKHFSSTEGYQSALQKLMKTGRYALAHGLLASLRTREAVTTNYDDLYERACRTDGRTCAVLPYEPVVTQDRWLLKLHGTVDRPEEIVLTRPAWSASRCNTGESTSTSARCASATKIGRGYRVE